MRSTLILVATLAIGLAASPPCAARVEVWHQEVAAVAVDLRTQGVVVLAEQAITVDCPGRVLVHFDGECVSAPGDLIMLAAEDGPHWGADDAHTAVRAYDEDVDLTPFSHSRMFVVGPGDHLFCAVGQNVTELGGSGVASVRGSLTVTFYPDGCPGARVWHRGVTTGEVDLRGPDHVLAVQQIGVPVAGRALVRFDGFVRSSAGDRVDLWVGRTLDFPVYDDMVAVEAPDGAHDLNNFSHARVYTFEPGVHDIYVMASNLVETGGTGTASFCGNLTVELLPGTSQAFVRSTGVMRVFIDVRSAPVQLGQVTIDAPHAGTAVVRFEGVCFAATGDRIVLAASDDPAWEPEDGGVGVEIVNPDSNHDCFTHTRVCRIETPGQHTFYGFCQNDEETEGTGMGSFFANLSVEFYADEPAAVGGETPTPALSLEPNYPNPFNPATTIAFELETASLVELTVHDLAGRLVRTLARGVRGPGRWVESWDGTNTGGAAMPSGTYLCRLSAGDRRETRKMQLVR